MRSPKGAPSFQPPAGAGVGLLTCTNMDDVARTRDQEMRNLANADGDAISAATNERVGQGQADDRVPRQGKGLASTNLRLARAGAAIPASRRVVSAFSAGEVPS